jgi:hypothetical protein
MGAECGIYWKAPKSPKEKANDHQFGGRSLVLLEYLEIAGFSRRASSVI